MRILLLLVSWLTITACVNEPPGQKFANALAGKSLYLMEGEVKTNPSDRVLHEVAIIGPKLTQAIHEYIATGNVKMYGFVSSELYLQARAAGSTETLTYGLVVSGGTGRLVGIDVSGGNATNVPITGYHTLVQNKNQELEKLILNELALYEKESSGAGNLSPVNSVHSGLGGAGWGDVAGE